MVYNKRINLKDGRDCLIRNGVREDGPAALDLFILTHEQTDLLLTYPDECSMTAGQEADYLADKTDSPNEIELVAEVGGRLVGLAGFESVGSARKVRHRAQFGISVDRDFWGLGLGTALTRACIDLAAAAGYLQLELNVVAENERAIALYEKLGFVEYGRDPMGFLSRSGLFQEVVFMRLEL